MFNYRSRGKHRKQESKNARTRAQEERNSILFLFVIQRTKCPPFDPFFGAPSMLATARGAKRHLGELHVSGSKGGILRPSRLRSRIPYGFWRLRRGLKTKCSLAFESPCLLCQAIPFCPWAECWTKCWAEGFFHGKNWIYTSNTFDFIVKYTIFCFGKPGMGKKWLRGDFGGYCWVKVLGRMRLLLRFVKK